MSVSPPRISIVTPCLNRAEFLGEAIESVLAQKYSDVEHIMIDGGSTDGTLPLLARYDHLRVISEPDTGLYDALNKGLRLATGEIIGHLNSDDAYAPEVFALIAAAFQDPSVDAVFGGAEVLVGASLQDASVVRRFITPREIELSVENVTHGICITNARFFRRRVYERVGYTDLRYRIASDRDFLLRVALTEPKAALLSQVVYRYRMHPGSLTINRDEPHAVRVRDEYLTIAEEHLRDPALPASARRSCRFWHARESATGALQAALVGDWPLARCCARRGMRVSGAWPATLARHLAGWVRDRLFRAATS